MAQQGNGWARGLGFLAGVAIVGLAVLGWRLPAGTVPLGADLIVATAPTGELAVSAAGPILTAPSLHPGAESVAPSATVKLYNRTAVLLEVRVVASPSSYDLDDLLWVRLEAGGTRIFRGPLAGLVKGAPPFKLASQERTTLAVRTWLPASAPPGYEGRVVNVDLTYDSTPVRSG